MLKFVTRLLRRKADRPVEAPYVLPSDDPELNPLAIDAARHEPAVIEPIADAAPRIEDVRAGLSEIGAQVRLLGQRLQAQTMGQARLIEALNALPNALHAQGHGRTLHELQAAVLDNSRTTGRFAEALKPLPEITQAQTRAIEQMSGQLAAHATAQTEQLKQVAEQWARLQRAQMAQFQAALEALQKQASDSRRASGRSQQTFTELQGQLRRSVRAQYAVAGALVLAAAIVAALALAGAFRPQSAPTDPRVLPSGTVLQR